MNAVDTNILLYVHDPRDASKQRAADALLDSLSEGALLWQVACEHARASHSSQLAARLDARIQIESFYLLGSKIPRSLLRGASIFGGQSETGTAGV
jgi:hypothetical protein